MGALLFLFSLLFPFFYTDALLQPLCEKGLVNLVINQLLVHIGLIKVQTVNLKTTAIDLQIFYKKTDEESCNAQCTGTTVYI